MSATPPPAPTQQRSTSDTVRNYVGIAFAASIVLHLVLGPLLISYKPPKPEKDVTEKVSVVKKIKVVVPTPPPPTPTPPPPTPPPKRTPPPVKQTAPPPVKKLKLNVVKQKTKSTQPAPAEKQYVAPPVGDQNGVPQGNAATGAPAPVKSTAAPATAAPPAPTPVPTPTKPSCTVPNQPASVVSKVTPDYPDEARNAGASGTAEVKVDLSATGGVLDVSIYKSAGNNFLDREAMRAARTSTYSPEIVDCVKTAKSYLFQAEFDPQ